MVLFCKPRICREKRLCAPPIASAVGSPPRMRGKGLRDLVEVSFVRITPAYAGKSSSSVAMSRAFTDHPRVCGEKCCFGSSCSPSTGSPPRMRGKVSRCCSRRAACGGSPPRMRGKVVFDEFIPERIRITPAYAGKRLKRSRSTVPPVAIVPLFPSVCNKPVVSDGSPAGRDAPLFLPAENAVPASPAYNLRSL